MLLRHVQFLGDVRVFLDDLIIEGPPLGGLELVGLGGFRLRGLVALGLTSLLPILGGLAVLCRGLLL